MAAIVTMLRLVHLSPDYFLGTEYFLELGANAA